MLPFLFYNARSSSAQIANIIAAARNNRRRSALSTEIKEDSLPAGFHDFGSVTFTLARPLTSPTTKDISGYAIDDKYLAIIPTSTKKFLSADKSTVFVDPKTQTLNELTDIVEKTEDGVFVYKKKQIEQGLVFTQIKVSLSSSPCDVNMENKKDIKAKCSYPVYVNWDKTTHRPIPKPIDKIKGVGVGLGAFAKASVDSELYIYGLTNVKLTMDVRIEAEIGALLKISPTKWVLKKEFVIGKLSYPLLEPSISFSILGFDIEVKITLDLKFSVSDIILELSAPIEYYKGYKFNLHKSIVATKDGYTQSEWQYTFRPVPSPSQLEEGIQTFINNAKLYFTPSIQLQIAAIFKCGFVTDSALRIGAIVFIPFEFGASTINCPAPYLYGSVHPRIDGFITFEGLTVAGKELLQPMDIRDTIYQMKKYQMCLFSAHSTVEGDEHAIQKRSGESYIVHPVSLQAEAAQGNIVSHIIVSAKSSKGFLNSLFTPMITIGKSMLQYLNGFMIVDMPPKDSTLYVNLLSGTSSAPLLPERQISTSIKSSYLKAPATIKTSVEQVHNIDISKEFTMKSRLISFKPTDDGSYVHLKSENGKYNIMPKTQFFDETLVSKSADVKTGQYNKQGKFFEIKIIDVENSGTESYPVAFQVGYESEYVSSFIVNPPAKKVVTAKQARLENWKTIVSTGHGNIKITSTDKTGNFGVLGRLSTVTVDDMLTFTEKQELTFKQADIVIRIEFIPYTPLVIANCESAEGKSIIARKFTSPVHNSQEVTAKVTLNEDEFYSVLEFPFATPIESGIKGAYAIVNTDGLSPLISCEEIGDSSYAIPIKALEKSLVIPFRKAEIKSEYMPRLICVVQASDSGSLVQDNAHVYSLIKSGIVHAGAIINKGTPISFFSSNGPKTSFKRSIIRKIDDYTEIAICSISSPSASVMMIKSLIKVPENSLKTPVNTKAFEKVLSWGYTNVDIKVDCERAGSMYTTDAKGNVIDYLAKKGKEFIVNIKKVADLIMYPVCESPNSAFCIIREIFDPNNITLIEYGSSEGVESNSTLGEGFMREIITGVSSIAYSKTWEGEVKRISSIPRTGNELTLQRERKNGRTDFCFAFGSMDIPASRSKYFADPEGFLNKLGITPDNGEFKMNDIEVTDKGCISASNSVVNREVTAAEVKGLVDVEDCITSVSIPPMIDHEKVNYGLVIGLPIAAVIVIAVAVTFGVLYYKRKYKEEFSPEFLESLI